MRLDNRILCTKTGTKLVNVLKEAELLLSDMYHSGIYEDEVNDKYHELYDRIDLIQELHKTAKGDKNERTYY